jgi:hypothetical protein
MANGEFLNYMNQSQKNEMEGICEEVVRKLVLGSSKRLMNPQIVVPTNEITSSNSVPFPGRHEIASCSFFTIDPADEKASNHIFRNITSDSFLLRRPPELKKILKDLRVQNHNMGLQVTPEKDALSAVGSLLTSMIYANMGETAVARGINATWGPRTGSDNKILKDKSLSAIIEYEFRVIFFKYSVSFSLFTCIALRQAFSKKLSTVRDRKYSFDQARNTCDIALSQFGRNENPDTPFPIFLRPLPYPIQMNNIHSTNATA